VAVARTRPSCRARARPSADRRRLAPHRPLGRRLLGRRAPLARSGSAWRHAGRLQPGGRVRRHRASGGARRTLRSSWRRGTRVEKITLSRIRAGQAVVAVACNPFSGDGHQMGWSRNTGLGKGRETSPDPAVSGESIAQGSRPKCDGHFARPPARGVFSPGFGFFLWAGVRTPTTVEPERDAIRHANGAGRVAAKRSDAVVRLFYRRNRPVARSVSAPTSARMSQLTSRVWPGECEPALDLKSIGRCALRYLKRS